MLKRMKGHARSNVKQLILTSGVAQPRLFYVDAVTLKLKECEFRVDVESGDPKLAVVCPPCMVAADAPSR